MKEIETVFHNGQSSAAFVLTIIVMWLGAHLSLCAVIGSNSKAKGV
jgi:hypothetical protein